MSSSAEQKKIKKDIEDIINLNLDTYNLLDGYREFSQYSLVDEIIKKYLNGLKKNILRWDKLKREYKARGLEKAGDFSSQALNYKIELGFNRVSDIYEEFLSETERLGLFDEFQTYLDYLSDPEEFENDYNDDELYDDEIYYYDSSEYSYLSFYIDKAERGEPYMLPDTINLQIRRELKHMEKEYKELRTALYRAQYGSRSNEKEADALDARCFRLRYEMDVRKMVLRGKKK